MSAQAVTVRRSWWCCVCARKIDAGDVAVAVSSRERRHAVCADPPGHLWRPIRFVLTDDADDADRERDRDYCAKLDREAGAERDYR